MQDTFNSPNLPANDTIGGMKVAVATISATRRAIERYLTEKDQISTNTKKATLVTGAELRDYFDRNAEPKTETKEDAFEQER